MILLLHRKIWKNIGELRNRENLIIAMSPVPSKMNGSIGIIGCEGYSEKVSMFRLRDAKTSSFDSQNTYWIKNELFDLLYLPSTATSQKTSDLIRSSISKSICAQRQQEIGLLECHPKPLQQQAFESKTLSSTIPLNQSDGYTELVKNNILDTTEIQIFQEWITQIRLLLKIKNQH